MPNILSGYQDHGYLGTISVEFSALHSFLRLIFASVSRKIIGVVLLDRSIFDAEIASIVQFRQWHNADFWIELFHSLQLIFHTSHDGVSQLVVPKEGEVE